MNRRVSTPRGRGPGSRKPVLLRHCAGGAERPQQEADEGPAWSETPWLMRDSRGGLRKGLAILGEIKDWWVASLAAAYVVAGV